VQGIGAAFGIHLGATEPATNYREATRINREMENRFILGCVNRGLYLHTFAHKTPMHHQFSAQHTKKDMAEALNIMEDALREL
jgi:glutamate-1-semialdehyde aminotransferase